MMDDHDDNDVTVFSIARDRDALGYVESVAWSNDGGLLACGTNGGSIELWSVTDRERVSRIRPFRVRIPNLRFGKSTGLLYAAAWDGPIVKIQFSHGSSTSDVLSFDYESNRWLHFDITGDESVLAISGGGDTAVSLFSLPDLAQRRRIPNSARPLPRGLAIAGDGSRLAVVSDYAVALWDTNDTVRLWQFDEHTGYASSVAMSPDNRWVATGDTRHVRLFDSISGELIQVRERHEGTVNSVAFSPDSKFLASGGDIDATIVIWSIPVLEEVKTLRGHRSGIREVVFSPDGQTLASASADGTVRIWPIVTTTESDE